MYYEDVERRLCIVRSWKKKCWKEETPLQLIVPLIFYHINAPISASEGVINDIDMPSSVSVALSYQIY